MPLSREEEIDLLAQKVAEELDKKTRAFWVEPETHFTHHQYVTAQIDRQRDRNELRNQVIKSACIWALPIVIGWFVAASWSHFIKLVAGALK